MLLLHNLSTSLKILFFFGICPFQFNNRKCFISWQSLTYQTIFLVGSTVIVIYNFQWLFVFINNININSSSWNTIFNSDISKYCKNFEMGLLTIVYCLILFESNRQQRNHVKFFNRFSDFNYNLKIFPSNTLQHFSDPNLFKWLLSVILIHLISMICFRMFDDSFSDYNQWDINTCTAIVVFQMDLIILMMMYIRHISMLLLNRYVQIKCAFQLNLNNKKDIFQNFTLFDEFYQLKIQYSCTFNVQFVTSILFDFVSIIFPIFATLINWRSRKIIYYDFVLFSNYCLVSLVKILLFVNIFDKIGKQVNKLFFIYFF